MICWDGSERAPRAGKLTHPRSARRPREPVWHSACLLSAEASLWLLAESPGRRVASARAQRPRPRAPRRGLAVAWGRLREDRVMGPARFRAELSERREDRRAARRAGHDRRTQRLPARRSSGPWPCRSKKKAPAHIITTHVRGAAATAREEKQQQQQQSQEQRENEQAALISRRCGVSTVQLSVSRAAPASPRESAGATTQHA